MGLLELIILIALLGLVVWAVTNFIPMPPQFRTMIIVIAVVVVVLFVLQQFGLVPNLNKFRIK
jgi:hypothetical protein